MYVGNTCKNTDEQVKLVIVSVLKFVNVKRGFPNYCFKLTKAHQGE